MSTATATAAATAVPATRASTRSRRSPPSPSTFSRIDPTLQDAGPSNPSPPTQHFTLSSLSGPDDTTQHDPLSNFARSVIDAQHPMTGEDDDVELFHPEDGLEAAVLAAEALDDEAERMRTGAVGLEAEADLHKFDTDLTGLGDGVGMGGDQQDSSLGQHLLPKRKRNHQNGELVAEESRDLARIKKDSHKEVERKRRDNINEGIVQIGRLVPTATDKLGKGHVLRLAVQHMTELAAKVEQADSNYARLDEEKQKIQGELQQAQAQLTEEHNRSITLETSWREAEDRAAASQFELERVKKELEDAKMSLLEKRR